METLDTMKEECPNFSGNTDFCTCTYDPCPRHGLCCQCVQYHQKKNQIPGCFFPPEIEKTYDRSYRKFAETYR